MANIDVVLGRGEPSVADPAAVSGPYRGVVRDQDVPGEQAPRAADEATAHTGVAQVGIPRTREQVFTAFAAVLVAPPADACHYHRGESGREPDLRPPCTPFAVPAAARVSATIPAVCAATVDSVHAHDLVSAARLFTFSWLERF